MAISTIWIKRTFCSFMALMEINVPFLPHVGVSTHKRLDPWIPYLVSWSMDPKSVGTKSWYRHRWIPWYHDQQWVWLIRRIPILWVWFIRRWDNIPWWLIGVITWYIVLHTQQWVWFIRDRHIQWVWFIRGWTNTSWWLVASTKVLVH